MKLIVAEDDYDIDLYYNLSGQYHLILCDHRYDMSYSVYTMKHVFFNQMKTIKEI